MKFISKAKISIITTLFTLVFVLGSYSLYARDFREPGLYYETAFEAYHQELNEFFNKKINHARELLEDDAFMKDEKKRQDFVVPADIDYEKDSLNDMIEKCKQGEMNNVSPLCVSMESMRIYMDYLEILEEMKSTLVASNENTISGKLLELGQKNEAIEKEVEDARLVLENTMVVYNEFLHAYPMHIKYQSIIKQLLQYKLALKDIRKRVQWFPVKFIDATSADCN